MIRHRTLIEKLEELTWLEVFLILMYILLPGIIFVIFK